MPVPTIVKSEDAAHESRLDELGQSDEQMQGSTSFGDDDAKVAADNDDNYGPINVKEDG